MKPTARLFVALLPLCLGCTHLAHPGDAPDVAMDNVGPFDEKLSVRLVNDQPDTEPKLFFSSMGHKYNANLNEWTRFVIDELTAALKARGAQVSDSSPNRIGVKLHDMRSDKGFSTIQTHAKLSLSGGGWSKQYEVTGSSGWSLGRALGGMVYLFVEKLLTDPEFLARLR